MMTSSNSIAFHGADSVAWNGYGRQAQFWASIGDSEVLCRVSREALVRRMGPIDTAADCLRAARENFPEISERCAALIEAQRFETNGTILMGPLDWSAPAS